MTDNYGLNRHLDSAAATPLAADLLELRGNPLRVDGSAVSFAGALPLQVLIAAKKQWADDDQSFQVAPLSPELAKAAKVLGIELPDIGARPEDVLTAEERA